MKSFHSIDGSIVAPQGFLAAGIFCDVKRLGTGKGSNKGKKRDLAVIVSEVPAKAAGMFTTNQICAAPVKLCVEHIADGNAQAVVINSGNANACTGPRGLKDAHEMTALLADELLLQPTDVLVGSTGRIGLLMPMPNIRTGIREIVKELDNAPSAAHHAAEAIMTSDTRAKEIALEFKLAGKSGKTVCLGGIGKGAGMIQPGMSPTGVRPATAPLHATMLAYLTTDAKVDARTLRTCLREAVATSFNCITVDGDMSTNDTVLILANGLAGNKKLSARDLKIFQAALNHVCLELAKMMVRDGEGITRMVTVRVKGAKTQKDAAAAARAVGNSTLVKTSWHGGDPNWGRIIDALGYSSAKVIEEKVDIAYSAPDAKALIHSLKKGRPTKATFKSLCKAVAPAEFDLHINLNLGKATATLYAADLTEEYVDFNKGDITNPASLGG